MKIVHAFIVCMVLCVFMVQAQESDVVNKESGTEYKSGLKLYNEGKYSQAIPYFQKAYSLDNRNTAALFAHGLALNKIGKYREAAAQFEKVLEKEPAHEKALKSLAAAYINAGDNEKALSAYDRGISSAPKDSYYYLGKAKILINLKKFGDALPLIQKARELNPQSMEISEALAQTYVELGRMDDAYEIASDILGKDRNHARARVIVADYKRLKGKLGEALEDYRLAAKNIETKAYAEHFIEVINQKLEETEIEKEYEARLAADSTAKATVDSASATEPVTVSTEQPSSGEQPPIPESTDKKSGGGLWLLLIIVIFVIGLVIVLAVRSYRKH
ncbi:tetratricopeptide repeat protein [bacterium]|nr:tetratricopeptide repeat protein [bacterium]